MKREFSAGGIVFKKEAETIVVLISQHSQHHGWVFPKGFIGDKIAGESKEDTALRETQEETGIIGKILEPLNPVSYWYHMDGEKRHKTVYYFLMAYVGGNTQDHDWEMENVAWLPINQIENRLTFSSDKTVWKQAEKRIFELLS